MTNKQQQKEQHAWSKNYHHVTVFGKSSYQINLIQHLIQNYELAVCHGYDK